MKNKSLITTLVCSAFITLILSLVNLAIAENLPSPIYYTDSFNAEVRLLIQSNQLSALKNKEWTL